MMFVVLVLPKLLTNQILGFDYETEQLKAHQPWSR